MERVFNPRNPEELIKLIDGETAISAEKLVGVHIGTWLRVRGTISEVEKIRSGGSNSICVSMQEKSTSDENPIFLFLFFVPSQWQQALGMLNKGDTIQAQGKIYSISCAGYSGSISMKECEMINSNIMSNK